MARGIVAMTDALLVSDQHVPGGFFDNPPLGGRSPLFALSNYPSAFGEAGQRIGARNPGLAVARPGRRDNHRGSSRKERAIHAVNLLRERTRSSSQRDQTDREMRWVADNRYRFRGQWIAVEGETLLAVGNTAKEVFEKVGKRPLPPLVIQIEREDLPFAGW
jgi:hypothetical protein